MFAPANHYLIITGIPEKQIRGRVVYLQPFEERLRPERAIVYTVTSDWLGTYSHEAIYSMPERSISGRYTPHGYGDASGKWLLMGTFDVTAGSAPIP
jgi:hypothetical protein